MDGDGHRIANVMQPIRQDCKKPGKTISSRD